MTAKNVGVLILILAVAGCAADSTGPSPGGGGGGGTAGGEYGRNAPVPGPWRPDRDYHQDLDVAYHSGAEFCLRLAYKSRQRARRLLIGGTLLGAGSVAALGTGAVAIGRNEPVTRRERATNIAMPFIATAFGTLATLLIERSANASELAGELGRAVGQEGSDIEAAERCNEAFGAWDTGRATASRTAGDSLLAPLATHDPATILAQLALAAHLGEGDARKAGESLEASYAGDHDPDPDAARAEQAALETRLGAARRLLAAFLIAQDDPDESQQALDLVAALTESRASLNTRVQVAGQVHAIRLRIAELDNLNEAGLQSLRSEVSAFQVPDQDSLHPFDYDELRRALNDLSEAVDERLTRLAGPAQPQRRTNQRSREPAPR